MRILVVDDDPLTLHMVVYRLRQWGHDVISCTDGDSAWKVLERGSCAECGYCGLDDAGDQRS